MHIGTFLTVVVLKLNLLLLALDVILLYHMFAICVRHFVNQLCCFFLLILLIFKLICNLYKFLSNIRFSALERPYFYIKSLMFQLDTFIFEPHLHFLH